MKKIFGNITSAVKKLQKNKAVYYACLLAPILLFNLPLLLSGSKIIPGDPDYMFQLYEAFRKSMLEYHQLPFWNSWVAGGIPLYSNFSFGLLSPFSPFVLVFGTVMGIKIAIVFLQLIAFLGYYNLLTRYFKTSKATAILISYIPIFSSYFVYRTISGHFNFLLTAFFPWLLLLFFQRTKKSSWIYFSLIATLLIWSSPHYATIMSFAVIGIWYVFDSTYRCIIGLRTKDKEALVVGLKADIKFFVKSAATICILSAYRLYFSYIFISDFPRPAASTNEPYTGILRGAAAIWAPNQYDRPFTLPTGWGWPEASTYIGIGTLLCLLLVMLIYAKAVIRKTKRPFTYPIVILVSLFILFFILGMGNFGRLSPYAILNALPVFNSMRVATRWLMWASLIVLFILASYNGKKYRKLINLILLVTVIELFVTGFRVAGKAFSIETQQYRQKNAMFDQMDHYRVPRPKYEEDQNYLKQYFYDENLYETTKNNYGQVIAGDSLVDTRQLNATNRCGSNNMGCKFISDNAAVTYWSPNKIVITRMAPGPIGINMNPGRGWTVNHKYVFNNYKVTDPIAVFIIDDPSETITLEYAPKYSPAWIKNKFTN